ncbi:MAG: aminotransferase class I/II-fold pyridoxal phosphate-dependent enzyme [Bacillota bacterium]
MPGRDQKRPLFTAVREHLARKRGWFHTPAHGGGRWAGPPGLSEAAWWSQDLTELAGLDSLLQPTGPLAASQDRAAELAGAGYARYLTGGASQGIKAALLAAVGPGDAVLLPRHTHRSVVDGLVLSGAEPVWLEPRMSGPIADGVTADDYLAALATRPFKAVLVTHPTYHGAAIDLVPVVSEAHARGATIIVDEAHGSLFGFSPDLPDSGVAAGADLVIQSWHKGAGALTQAAILFGRPGMVSQQRLDGALRVLSSSSPSYLLLLSLEAAAEQLRESGPEAAGRAIATADQLRNRLASAGFSCYQPGPGFRLDPTKVTVWLPERGEAVARELAQAGLDPEMHGRDWLLFLVSPALEPEEAQRLVMALEVFVPAGLSLPATGTSWPEAVQICRPAEAFHQPWEPVRIEEAAGRTAAETVCPYPPGIPLLVPGERIDPVIQQRLLADAAAGYLPRWVNVVSEKEINEGI